ncbi:MAG: RsmD family RNA methyltransferase [Phycisphaerae bacterium]
MRIIAGTFRTRRLLGPDTLTTRPITDRAKQSLFDALTCAVTIPDSVVLDCFAGTGSLGLECLSRGAARAIFVERDRQALNGLRHNIGALRVEAVCEVLPADAYDLGELVSEKVGGQRLELAFIDPPYAHLETFEGRNRVANLTAGIAELMAPDGLMILRHPAEIRLEDMVLRARVVRELQYGKMAITWLTAGAASEK